MDDSFVHGFSGLFSHFLHASCHLENNYMHIEMSP